MSAVINLNTTIGAVEVGMIISTFLFGVFTCQSYIYYRNFPQDSLVLKLLVGLIYLLELGHWLALVHMVYTITVTDFGDLSKLVKAPYSLDVSILFSAFIGPLVQAWFAYRVLKFSQQLYIPVFCWVLSFLRCVATIVTSIKAFMAPSIVEYEQKQQWILTFILAVGAVVDVVIAASLCYYLRKYRTNSFRTTVKLVNQVMIWTIETGLLTSVAAVIMLIFFLVMKDNFVWIGIFTFLAKLFSNSLLVALNARNVKSNHPTEASGTYEYRVDIPPSTASKNIKLHTTMPNFNGIAIEMSRTTEVVHDDQFMDKRQPHTPV